MDRETEWVNQELETYLRLFTSNKPEEWTSILPIVEFAHNSTTHLVTQKTQFSLMMGYEPCAYPLLRYEAMDLFFLLYIFRH